MPYCVVLSHSNAFLEHLSHLGVRVNFLGHVGRSYGRCIFVTGTK